VDSVKALEALPQDKRQGLADAMSESGSAATAYAADRSALVTGLAAFCNRVARPPQTNTAQHVARQAFRPLAESARGLVKQIDLLYKLAARAAQLAQELAVAR
jgi:type I restriction enzyme M protein